MVRLAKSGQSKRMDPSKVTMAGRHILLFYCSASRPPVCCLFVVCVLSVTKCKCRCVAIDQGISTIEVWAGPLSNNGVAVVLLNRTPSPQTFTANWAEIGVPAGRRMLIRDIWCVLILRFVVFACCSLVVVRVRCRAKRDLGIFTNKYVIRYSLLCVC